MKDILDKEGVASVLDKIIGNEVEMACDEKCRFPIRRCERLALANIKRGKGKSKKYWGQVIRQNMTRLDLTEDDLR